MDRRTFLCDGLLLGTTVFLPRIYTGKVSADYTDQNAALLDALLEGRIETIKTLVHGGTDVNFRNRNGNTPLHYAAMCYRNADVAELLIAHGADVNAKNERNSTPLHEAAFWNKNGSIVQLLLASGADANVEDDFGITPLLYAKLRGRIAAVQYFSQVTNL